MERNEAIRLIRNTFEDSFDEGRFRNFMRELLNDIDESKRFSYQGQFIWEVFRSHINRYERIGTYTDPDGEKVDVLIVHLKKESSLDQARTLQRNFVARYLKERGEKKAALVAYHTDGLEDWRFSWVRMEYRLRLDSDSGKVKVENELTPARRYSFLVGQNEPNHTAQQQLLPILQDDLHNPTLAQLEDAFNIESVTRAFFNEYRELFLLLREELDERAQENKKVAAEFSDKVINTDTFAKKLLGQIVFLYFLQKKGWLGVQPDKDWGTGPRDFMRQLYDGQWRSYTNFFHDILEPLFYEALALLAPDNFYSPFKCRMPFLNGGLFDPPNGYNWRATDLRLENATFRRILDTFDRYNFTVREDEPLEKEVAIDPEMLGKVFENLLEVRDRRSSGSYYTPRAIVHYMCQESLIQYLDTTLNWEEVPLAQQPPVQGHLFGQSSNQQKALTERRYVPKVPLHDLETFIRRGEMAAQNELAAQEGVSGWVYQLPPSIRQHAKDLDNALADIRVCDPAIGSGAFPMGMVQEIVRARTTLTAYLGQEDLRKSYNLKWRAIERSIYGVDIDQAAIDIAKLRLWLSLVVDEESYDGIRPLPNLDYKIVCGDSLSKSVRGGDLFKSRELAELRRLQDQIYGTTDPASKAVLQREINALLRTIGDGSVRFDYQVFFNQVFGEKGGFDIVIANPPYVRQERLSDDKKFYQQTFPEVYAGTADIYIFFYRRGLEILRENGCLAFITSNKYMRAGYGRKLRSYLANSTDLYSLIDFGDLPVFEATAYPSILITRKRAPVIESEFHALRVDSIDALQDLPDMASRAAWLVPQTALRPEGWFLVRPEIRSLMGDLRRHRTPLNVFIKGRFFYGIKTGFNEAFVIDKTKHQELVRKNPKNASVLKPWLRGRDIKRWKITWNEEYLIAIQNSSDKDAKNSWATATNETRAKEIFRNDFPHVYDHLSTYESELRRRQDQGRHWWELRACAYFAEFSHPKIVFPDIAKRPEFAYDDEGRFYGGNTLYIMPTKSLYLLAILNSLVVEFFYINISSTVRGDYLRFIASYVSQIPVPDTTSEQQSALEVVVRYLLFLGSSKDKVNRFVSNQHLVQVFEDALNGCVYELYFPKQIMDREVDVIRLVEVQFPRPAADEGDESMLAAIETAYQILRDPEGEIRNRLIKQKLVIDEIRIINEALR